MISIYTRPYLKEKKKKKRFYLDVVSEFLNNYENIVVCTRDPRRRKCKNDRGKKTARRYLSVPICETVASRHSPPPVSRTKTTES